MRAPGHAGAIEARQNVGMTITAKVLFREQSLSHTTDR